MKEPKRKPAPRRIRGCAPADPKAIPKTPVWQISPEEQIVGAPFLGKVKLYNDDAGIITLVLEAALAAGDMIRIKGRLTDLTQRVERMKADGETVQSASPGETVAIQIANPARVGDAVYKV